MMKTLEIADKNSTGKPIYSIIAEDIQLKILNNILRPGDILPTEKEFSQMYNASRETVRKGLGKLEQAGYIKATPGRGYFVIKPVFSRFSLDFSEDDYTSELTNIDVKTGSDAILAELKVASNRFIVEMERLLKKDGVPFAVEYKYLPYTKGWPVIEEELEFAVFPELIANRHFFYAFYTKMRIDAAGATDKIAEKLDCKPNEPMLLVHRHFLNNNDQLIAYSKRYIKQGTSPLECYSGIQMLSDMDKT